MVLQPQENLHDGGRDALAAGGADDEPGLAATEADCGSDAGPRGGVGTEIVGMGDVLRLKAGHVIVVEKAEIGGGAEGPVDAFDGLCERDGIASLVHHGKVGGFAAGFDLPADPFGDEFGVAFAHHPLVVDLLVESRIEGAVAPVDKGLADDVGKQDRAFGGVNVAELGSELLQNVEHLNQRSSGSRRRKGEEAVSFKAAAQRLAFDGMRDLGKVVEMKQTVVGPHVPVDLLGDAAEVEVFHALVGEAFEGFGEDRLSEVRADGKRAFAVAQEERGGGVGLEMLEGALGEGVLQDADGVAFGGQADGGLGMSAKVLVPYCLRA